MSHLHAQLSDFSQAKSLRMKSRRCNYCSRALQATRKLREISRSLGGRGSLLRLDHQWAAEFRKSRFIKTIGCRINYDRTRFDWLRGQLSYSTHSLQIVRTHVGGEPPLRNKENDRFGSLASVLEGSSPGFSGCNSVSWI